MVSEITLNLVNSGLLKVTVTECNYILCKMLLSSGLIRIYKLETKIRELSQANLFIFLKY